MPSYLFFIFLSVFSFELFPIVFAKAPNLYIPIPNTNANIDILARRLVQNPIHDPEVYSKALAVLENLQSAPSCHRLATVSLIDSCQTLEPSENSDAALSDVREDYATKLAMCELSGAKAQTPSQCAVFLPSETFCNSFGQGLMARFRSSKPLDDNSSLCYADSTKSQLKACLYALHTKPQWWTSYSNALNNVLVVCQASRGAVERDDIIQIFRTNTHMTKEISIKLANTLKMATEYSAQIDRVREQTINDLAKHSSQLKEFANSIMHEFNLAVQRVVGLANTGTSSVSSAMSNLQTDIVNVHSKIMGYDDAVSSLVHKVADSSGKMQQVMVTSMGQAQQVYVALASVSQQFPEMQKYMDANMKQLLNFSLVLQDSHELLEERVVRQTQLLQEQAGYISTIANYKLDVGTIVIFLTSPALFQILLPKSPFLAALACGLFFTFFRACQTWFIPLRATINWAWTMVLLPSIHSNLQYYLGPNYRVLITTGLSLSIYLLLLMTTIVIVIRTVRLLIQRRNLVTKIFPINTLLLPSYVDDVYFNGKEVDFVESLGREDS